MNIFDTILGLIFPAKCISCGKIGSDLCLECISSCRSAERECADWIFPLYDYRSPIIKKSVWLLKYKGKKRIAGVFAEAMYGKIMEELYDFSELDNFKSPTLVPIPLSKKRMHERGFNQALLICEKLIKLDKDKLLALEKNFLVKQKDTEHQARIENRTERLKNIVGSFSIKNKELVRGKRIILIDDVTTTGATLAEARKMLKQAGAKKVIAFTVAH